MKNLIAILFFCLLTNTSIAIAVTTFNDFLLPLKEKKVQSFNENTLNHACIPHQAFHNENFTNDRRSYKRSFKLPVFFALAMLSFF